jgi:phenylacetate-CoA ligase
MEWTGYRFGDRQTRLWHQTIGMSRGQALRERLDAWLCRRQFIPVYELSLQTLPRLIRKIRRHRPVLIDGYAEAFNLVAAYLKGSGARGVRPKGVISSAQILPEQSRRLIEQEMGCAVFDKYGSREFSGIAYESEAHEGHLVVAESYIVEILVDGRPARPGELGEVVITDLNNHCMPLIRYRIGDLAEAMDSSVRSPCGRGLPRIGRIEGRVQSIIVGANGRFLPGTFFAHLFKDLDHMIQQYQVVQERPGAIRLKVVPAARLTDSGLDEVLALLRRYMGEAMEIEVERVSSIELLETGKHQGAISRLDIDLQRLGDGSAEVVRFHRSGD